MGVEASLLRPLLTSARTIRITPVAPPFRPSLTRGYAQQISPNKGRELSLHKCVVYRWSLSEYGFVDTGPLATGSLLASTTFLFVTSQLWRDPASG